MNLTNTLLRLALLPLVLAGAAVHAGEPAALVDAAKSQIGVTLRYDPSYERLAFPNGDVPIERGVCTDVIVRAYRKQGVDLCSRQHARQGVVGLRAAQPGCRVGRGRARAREPPAEAAGRR